MTNTVLVRLYEHPETRARVEGSPDLEVELHGWDHEAGDVFSLSAPAETYQITRVYSDIRTGDARGNYVLAAASELSPEWPNWRDTAVETCLAGYFTDPGDYWDDGRYVLAVETAYADDGSPIGPDLVAVLNDVLPAPWRARWTGHGNGPTEDLEVARA